MRWNMVKQETIITKRQKRVKGMKGKEAQPPLNTVYQLLVSHVVHPLDEILNSARNPQMTAKPAIDHIIQIGMCNAIAVDANRGITLNA